MSKKRNIVLTVEGYQSADGQKDKVELMTVASLEEQENAFIIKYKEEQEPPLKAIDVEVLINYDNSKAQITRFGGDIHSCLIVERSKRNMCHYGTEFGDILMGIYGRELESSLTSDGGTFDLVYDIDMNGVMTSRNEVKMIFKNNQESI